MPRSRKISITVTSRLTLTPDGEAALDAAASEASDCLLRQITNAARTLI